jgi:hypothetical protein
VDPLLKEQEHLTQRREAAKKTMQLVLATLRAFASWREIVYSFPASGRGVALVDRMPELKDGEREPLYCPACEAEVIDPLVCGDCGAVICRKCGTPLEKIDELGIG